MSLVQSSMEAIVNDVPVFIDGRAIGMVDVDISWTFDQVRELAIAEGLTQVADKLFIAGIMESDVPITALQESKKKWSKYYAQKKIVMASKASRSLAICDDLEDSSQRRRRRRRRRRRSDGHRSSIEMVMQLILQGLFAGTHCTKWIIQATGAEGKHKGIGRAVMIFAAIAVVAVAAMSVVATAVAVWVASVIAAATVAVRITAVIVVAALAVVAIAMAADAAVARAELVIAVIAAVVAAAVDAAGRRPGSANCT
jgi:hypothetical protein